MAGMIRVTPEQLRGAGQQLATGAGEIESQISSMSSLVSSLAGDWVGSAEQRFQELWQKWQSGATQIHEALNGITQLINQASAAYEQAEQQIGQSFGA